MPSTADRTITNLEVVTPAGLSSFGVGGQPIIVLPQLGFNLASDIGTGTIVSGGPGVRVVYSFPDQFKAEDANIKVIAWIDTPNVLIHPQYVRAFENGWDSAETSSTGAVIQFEQNKKYVFELSAPDADHLSVKIWPECGGDPLATISSAVAAGSFTNPVEVYLGWPAELILEAFKADIPLQGAGHTDNAHYPYMVKIHNVSGGNEGPTGATFVQQTALSQAADLPAGTYVGYFVVDHPLVTPSHVTLIDVAILNEYEVKNNKLYTKVKGSLLSIFSTPMDITITDIFNKSTVDAPSAGVLTVTA